MLAHHPEYGIFAERLEQARIALQSAADECNAHMGEACKALSSVKPPPVDVAEAELSEDGIQPPLFTTDDDFVSATRRLKAHKELEDSE